VVGSTNLQNMPNRSRSDRVEVTLACIDCSARNYKTTKKQGDVGQLERKKFCVTCGHHTLHKETK